MKVVVDNGFDYVPLWNDNRSLPESEQIRVRFHFMSGVDLSRVLALSDDKEEMLKADFKAAVESIENFDIEVDGETRPCTVEDLLTLGGLQELYLELKTEYSERAVIDKKK